MDVIANHRVQQEQYMVFEYIDPVMRLHTQLQHAYT